MRETTEDTKGKVKLEVGGTGGTNGKDNLEVGGTM